MEMRAAATVLRFLRDYFAPSALDMVHQDAARGTVNGQVRGEVRSVATESRARRNRKSSFAIGRVPFGAFS